MVASLDLPPSIKVGPTTVGVSLITADGATVEVALPRPGGLYEISEAEIVSRARDLAFAALQAAAAKLAN